MDRVVINLVGNFADSIGVDSRITLRVMTDRLPRQGRHRDVAMLGVEDSGAGIRFYSSPRSPREPAWDFR